MFYTGQGARIIKISLISRQHSRQKAVSAALWWFLCVLRFDNQSFCFLILYTHPICNIVMTVSEQTFRHARILLLCVFVFVCVQTPRTQGVIPQSYDKGGVPASVETQGDASGVKSLDEIVVTAHGIRREKKSLGYSIQEISGSQVSDVKDQNLLNSLSGKVSGLAIRRNNSMGASSNVVIRGFKSLSGNNQALFVVDGVPIDNTNFNSPRQAAGLGGIDFGSTVADINPDDIESISVLKGAAASALYGSRANNGVVLITTKRARAKRSVSVTVSSSYTAGLYNPQTFIKYQKDYGAGYDPDGLLKADKSTLTALGLPENTNATVVDPTNDASLGPPFDPSQEVYSFDAFVPWSPFYRKARPWQAAKNDPSKFFKLSNTFSNYVSIENADDRGAFKLSYTRFDQTGILPNSSLTKNTAYANVQYNLTPQLRASVISNFVNQNSIGRYNTGYSPNLISGFRQWWQTNVDILEQKELFEASQQNVSWNPRSLTSPVGSRPIYWNNPYWQRYNAYSTDLRNRFYGVGELSYQFSKQFQAKANITYDVYSALLEERAGVNGVELSEYSRTDRTYSEIRYNGFVSYQDRLSSEFDINALVGTEIRVTKSRAVLSQTNGGLVFPGYYALNNSQQNTSPPAEIYAPIQVNGFFSNVSLGYRSIIYLDLTGRVDQASSLPLHNNTYFYPSASLSFVFTEWLNQSSKRFDWLTFGKVRLNYAQVGNFAPPLQVFDTYTIDDNFNGVPRARLPLSKRNNNLLPEKTHSIEVGLEATLFRDIIRLDVAYFRTDSRNQVLPLNVSYATGFRGKFVNAGSVINQGVEVSLGIRPVTTTDFSWAIDVNWTRYVNEVRSLYQGVSNIQISSFQGGVSLNSAVGQPYGVIRGKDYVYSPDGQKLIDEKTGRYLVTQNNDNILGNITPKWYGGVTNTFKFKNVVLSFLIDSRWGGSVYSLDMSYGLYTGLPAETGGLNDLGNPIRAPLDKGGGVILPGVVHRDGKYEPNTKRIEYATSAGGGVFGFNDQPARAFVYDASYVKLRELSLGYTFHKKFLPKVFQAVNISFVCKNPVILFKYLPYADPEDGTSAGNIQGYQAGSIPSLREFGGKMTFKF